MKSPSHTGDTGGGELDDEDLCIICFSNPQNSVNMPCGHGSLCINCSLDVLEKSDTCCICRELVEQVLELDMEKSHMRNDCWRVKKCYLFFEEGDSDSEEESESAFSPAHSSPEHQSLASPQMSPPMTQVIEASPE